MLLLLGKVQGIDWSVASVEFSAFREGVWTYGLEVDDEVNSLGSIIETLAPLTDMSAHTLQPLA